MLLIVCALEFFLLLLFRFQLKLRQKKNKTGLNKKKLFQQHRCRPKYDFNVNIAGYLLAQFNTDAINNQTDAFQMHNQWTEFVRARSLDCWIQASFGVIMSWKWNRLKSTTPSVIGYNNNNNSSLCKEFPFLWSTSRKIRKNTSTHRHTYDQKLAVKNF